MNLLVIKIGQREFIQTMQGVIALDRISQIEDAALHPRVLRFWFVDGSWLDREVVEGE